MLLAIVDIKNPETAKRVHRVILAELDISNLVRLYVEIWAYRIGGTEEMKYIYEYDKCCGDHPSKRGFACIKEEHCEKGYLLNADRATIEAGFNLYQALQILAKENSKHASLACFQRDDNEYLYLYNN